MAIIGGCLHVRGGLSLAGQTSSGYSIWTSGPQDQTRVAFMRGSNCRTLVYINRVLLSLAAELLNITCR